MTHQSTCLPLNLMITLGSLYISNLKVTCHQLKLINLKMDIHYLFYLSLCLVSNNEVTTKIRNLGIVWFALLFHKWKLLLYFIVLLVWFVVAIFHAMATLMRYYFSLLWCSNGLYDTNTSFKILMVQSIAPVILERIENK